MNLAPLQKAAKEFVNSLATDLRFHGTIYLGRTEHSTISSAVEAAFIAGWVARDAHSSEDKKDGDVNVV